jgi:hypothetical protein
MQTFRADYIDWCLPLFGSDYGSAASGEFDNYTCSFLATNGNMYFVNHTSGIWEKENCCLFEGVNYAPSTTGIKLIIVSHHRNYYRV